MLSRTLPFALGIVFAWQCAAQPDLGLFVQFDSRPSPAFVKNMQQEIAAVFPDFHVHWVTAGKTDSQTTYRRVLIVKFHGSCTAAEPVHAVFVPYRVALAETTVMNGAILPFSDIDCDRLRNFLDTADPNEMGRESRLGRATGRVLAHELYHVLLQTREHSKKGIGKAVQAPAALLSRSLRFEEGELELIRLRYR